MSRMQTVTMGHVGQGMGIEYVQRSQGQGSHRVSKIEAQGLWENDPEDTRLMIIELRKYNEVGVLLIEMVIAGLWGHGDWEGRCEGEV